MPWLLTLLTGKAWLVAATVAVVGYLAWDINSRAYKRGYGDAIGAIEIANKEANRKAGEGEAAVLACFAKGGNWNRETGKCDR